MYTLDIKKDGDLPIMFLDAMTFIPVLHEGSTYIDEAKRETFVIRFNKHYSKIAFKKFVNISSIPTAVILVPELYEEKKMGETPEPPQEISKTEVLKMIKPTISQWKTIFGLKGPKLKVLFYRMLKKHFIIK